MMIISLLKYCRRLLRRLSCRLCILPPMDMKGFRWSPRISMTLWYAILICRLLMDMNVCSLSGIIMNSHRSFLMRIMVRFNRFSWLVVVSLTKMWKENANKVVLTWYVRSLLLKSWRNKYVHKFSKELNRDSYTPWWENKTTAKSYGRTSKSTKVMKNSPRSTKLKVSYWVTILDKRFHQSLWEA